MSLLLIITEAATGTPHSALLWVRSPWARAATHELLGETEMPLSSSSPVGWRILAFVSLAFNFTSNQLPPSLSHFFFYLGAKLKNLLFTHRSNTATKCNPLNCFSSLLGGCVGGVGLCKVSLGLQAAYFLAPSQLHSTKNSLLIKKKKKFLILRCAGVRRWGEAVIRGQPLFQSRMLR